MFGFVRVHKDELRIKDYEAYKAVYCSLCRKLKKEYSFLSGFLLNYDCTFFALMCLGTSQECFGFHKGRCRYNPLKSCKYCKGGEEVFSKTAALLILMSYYKLLDNIHDGGFLKKLGCTLLRPFFSVWKNKASKLYPEYRDACEIMFISQLEYEDKKATVDECSEPTAILLKTVFAAEAKSDKIRPAYEQFGYHLGKWVYLMDAVCDIDDDVKHNSFNPIYEKLHKDKSQSTDYCNELLSQSLFLLTSAYRLIEINHFKSVIDNIVLVGLANKQQEVLFSRKEK